MCSEVRFLNEGGLDSGLNLQNWGSILALKNPQARLDSCLDSGLNLRTSAEFSHSSAEFYYRESGPNSAANMLLNLGWILGSLYASGLFSLYNLCACVSSSCWRRGRQRLPRSPPPTNPDGEIIYTHYIWYGTPSKF